MKRQQDQPREKNQGAAVYYSNEISNANIIKRGRKKQFDTGISFVHMSFIDDRVALYDACETYNGL